MQRYVTREGDMIDAICYRHYGFHAGTAEAVLDANYGLSERPPVLPAGIVIALPAMSRADAAPQPVRLWDDGAAA